MEDRTVWNNRLVDWKKLDAISLNNENKINANSIWNWNVSDTEFNYLNWLNWNIQQQIDNIDPTSWDWSEPIEVNDVINTEEWVFTFDGTWILQTFTSWAVNKYYPAYIERLDENWERTSKITMVWAYDAQDEQMVYTNWMTVKLTWEITYANANIAYRNFPNSFEETNTFNWDSIFNWNISMPFKKIETDFEVDGQNWLNQKVVLEWSNPHTINFSNMLSWAVYLVFVVQNWTWTVDLWTVTDSWTLIWTAVLNNETYPLTLAAGSHMFLFATADTKVHCAYIGQTI